MSGAISFELNAARSIYVPSFKTAFYYQNVSSSCDDGGDDKGRYMLIMIRICGRYGDKIKYCDRLSRC